MEDSGKEIFFSLCVSILDMIFQTSGTEANSLLKSTKTFSPSLTQTFLMQMSKQWLMG